MNRGAKRLAEYRRRNDLQQRKIAAALDIDQALVSQMECGHRLPDLSVAMAIEGITAGYVKAKDWLVAA
jgi:transcriptional regulator with XRE-family HTH domain